MFPGFQSLPPQFQQAVQQAQQMRPPSAPVGQSSAPPWMQYFPQSAQRFMAHPELAQLGQLYGDWMQQRGGQPFQQQPPFQPPSAGNWMQQPNQMMDMINSRIPQGYNTGALQSILSPMMAPLNMMQQFSQGQMRPVLSAYAPQRFGPGGY